VHTDITNRCQDSYELYIFWNQQLLPGSPFKIDLSTYTLGLSVSMKVANYMHSPIPELSFITLYSK